MSQTEVPTVGADEANGQHGGDSSVGRQPETSTFWGSMPRVLTALGGLVTAVGTAAAVYFGGIAGDDSKPAPPATNPPQILVMPAPAAPAPAPEPVSRNPRAGGIISGQIESSATGSDEIIAEWASSLDADTAALADGCGDGYSSDCEELLDILITDCEEGYALSCDVLFLVSPSDSALEEYGDSCGGRIRNNDEWCSDLVGG